MAICASTYSIALKVLKGPKLNNNALASFVYAHAHVEQNMIINTKNYDQLACGED